MAEWISDRLVCSIEVTVADPDALPVLGLSVITGIPLIAGYVCTCMSKGFG